MKKFLITLSITVEVPDREIEGYKALTETPTVEEIGRRIMHSRGVKAVEFDNAVEDI